MPKAFAVETHEKPEGNKTLPLGFRDLDAVDTHENT